MTLTFASEYVRFGNKQFLAPGVHTEQYQVLQLQFRLLLNIFLELRALVCLGLISQHSPQDFPTSRFRYGST